jgi:hypothetical protein
MIERSGPGWKLLIFTGDQPLDIFNDNVDVEVRLSDGTRWGATFFTLKCIATMMEEYGQTGKAAGGLYFWYADLVVVRDLAPRTIEECVTAMLGSGDLPQAFERLDNDVVDDLIPDKPATT